MTDNPYRGGDYTQIPFMDDTHPIVIDAARERFKQLVDAAIESGRLYPNQRRLIDLLGDTHPADRREFIRGLRNPDGSYETIDVTTHDIAYMGDVVSGSIHGKTPDGIIEDNVYEWDGGPVESVLFDGRIIYPNGAYEPDFTDWKTVSRRDIEPDAFALGGTPADRTPITAIYTPLPSDDDLYGKAVRDESGEPIATAQAPARTDRVNQDLEWFRQVNAGMKKLGLDGDEPLPPEPVQEAPAKQCKPRVRDDDAEPCYMQPPLHGDVDAPGWDFTKPLHVILNGVRQNDVVAYHTVEGWVELLRLSGCVVRGSQRERYYGNVSVVYA